MIALGKLLAGIPSLLDLPQSQPVEPKFELPLPEAPVLELVPPEILPTELVTTQDDDDTSDDEPPPTPLEQAVIDLLDRREPAPELAAPRPEARDHAPRIVAASPVSEPRALPEQAAPTSHVNLVLDDGDRRVVVTVAVRGTDVNVALRGGDDATAAALARNAALLDHALHARGLSLAEFTAGREREPEHHDRPQKQREETQHFVLEETP